MFVPRVGLGQTKRITRLRNSNNILKSCGKATNLREKQINIGLRVSLRMTLVGGGQTGANFKPLNGSNETQCMATNFVGNIRSSCEKYSLAKVLCPDDTWIEPNQESTRAHSDDSMYDRRAKRHETNAVQSIHNTRAIRRRKQPKEMRLIASDNDSWSNGPQAVGSSENDKVIGSLGGRFDGSSDRPTNLNQLGQVAVDEIKLGGRRTGDRNGLQPTVNACLSSGGTVMKSFRDPRCSASRRIQMLPLILRSRLFPILVLLVILAQQSPGKFVFDTSARIDRRIGFEFLVRFLGFDIG